MSEEKNTGSQTESHGDKESNKATFTGRIHLANETVDRDAPPPRPNH